MTPLQKYRLITHLIVEEHYGPSPWPCYTCKKPVLRLGGPNDKERGIVHHIDHDKLNNVIENLTIMHAPCHSSLHHKGRVKSDEERAKIGRGNKGKKRTRSTRKKISVAMSKPRPTRRIHPPRQKMTHKQLLEFRSKQQKERFRLGLMDDTVKALIKGAMKQYRCECGKECHAGPMKRHTNKSGHKAWPLEERRARR